MGYAPYYYDYEYEEQRHPLEDKFDEAQGFMVELYKELTAETPIDLNAVQFYMSELAGHLNIKDDGFGRLTIERDSNVIHLMEV